MTTSCSPPAYARPVRAPPARDRPPRHRSLRHGHYAGVRAAIDARGPAAVDPAPRRGARHGVASRCPGRGARGRGAARAARRGSRRRRTARAVLMAPPIPLRTRATRSPRHGAKRSPHPPRPTRRPSPRSRPGSKAIPSIAPDDVELELAESRTGESWYQRAKQLYDAHEYGSSGLAYERAAQAGYRAGTAYYNAACSYALDRQRSRSLGALSEAIDAGFGRLDLLQSDTDLNAIRDDGPLPPPAAEGDAHGPGRGGPRFAARALRPARGVEHDRRRGVELDRCRADARRRAGPLGRRVRSRREARLRRRRHLQRRLCRGHRRTPRARAGRARACADRRLRRSGQAAPGPGSDLAAR